MKQELICIGCPMGCQLTAEVESFPIDPAAIPADADTVTFVVEEAQAQ